MKNVKLIEYGAVRFMKSYLSPARYMRTVDPIPPAPITNTEL